MQTDHAPGGPFTHYNNYINIHLQCNARYKNITHTNSSESSFAPFSEESNERNLSVALAIFWPHSCPVVASDAVTTSIYSGKLTFAKTGALEATEPKKNIYKTQIYHHDTYVC